MGHRRRGGEAGEPYHILVLTTFPELGGGEMMLVSLACHLHQNRFHPLAVCPGGGSLSRELTRRGVAVETMGLGRFDSWRGMVPRPPLKAVYELLKLVKGNRVDLVHAYHYEALKLCGTVARMAGLPSVWTCHGFWYPATGTRARFINLIVDRIIAVSQFVKDSLTLGGVIEGDKVTVIPNSVDPAFLKEGCNPGKVRHEYGVEPDTLLLGVVARLEPLKGHRDFLLALRTVLDRVPNLKVLLVGEDLHHHPVSPYRSELMRLVAELSLSQHVVFAGFRSDMVDVYDALDMLVLPSHGEAFGLVLLEAMARGKAVIATDCGGPREIIQDGRNGLLVPPQNPEALAQAMVRLAGDAELRGRLGQAGRRCVEQSFRMESMVARTEELYLSLLEGKAA